MKFFDLAIIIVFIIAIFITSLFFYDDGRQSILKSMQETDGMQIDNWICYNAVDINRSNYIHEHEVCHYLVKQDYKHFCED